MLFNKGDTVSLKSGGPRMTVLGNLKRGDAVYDPWLKKGWSESDILCRWLDENAKQEKTQAFSPTWLDKIEK
jgi:uncharacterized protein YodC (DUF2158 family)